jgi:SAM-dependent methyltransferase
MKSTRHYRNPGPGCRCRRITAEGRVWISTDSDEDVLIPDAQTGYDLVADEYAAHFRDKLDGKPFDRKMLDWLVEQVNGLGLICDLGCGPGQVARYLQSRGAKVCGIDLSAEMVKRARALNPEIPLLRLSGN